MRFLNGLGRAKFFDVSAAREGLACTRDHHCFDRIVCHGFVQPLHECLAGGQTQSVDWWVVQGNHGDIAVDCIVSTHRKSLSEADGKVKKNDRTILYL